MRIVKNIYNYYNFSKKEGIIIHQDFLNYNNFHKKSAFFLLMFHFQTINHWILFLLCFIKKFAIQFR